MYLRGWGGESGAACCPSGQRAVAGHVRYASSGIVFYFMGNRRLPAFPVGGRKMNLNPPRIVIAGTGSGVGKTTITLGLLSALTRRGIRVQAFKAGPDYLDPGLHRLATGRPSRNLDTWMLGADGMREVFLKGAQGADLCLIEGVMGLFDGKDSRSNEGSTAEIAAELGAPVVLVLDAGAAARSVAAVVRGFQVFDPAVRIGGVILNRVGSEGHHRMLKAAIEGECNVPVLGSLHEDASHQLPEGNLGLVPTVDPQGLPAWLERLADKVDETIDLNALLAWARETEDSVKLPDSVRFTHAPPPSSGPVIAVARDEAFHFYYPENLELLQSEGARLRFFSPLAGEELPEYAEGLYIGGGFPEEFAEVLAGQEEVKRSIRDRIEGGLPTYAEGGGFMYLCESLRDRDGRQHPMVGVIPARMEMGSRLSAFGYREVRGSTDTLLLREGETARGHEFHYSRLSESPEWQPAWRTEGLYGAGWEGFSVGRLLATYTHLHFLSHPDMARRWVDACRQYRWERNH